MSSRVYIRKFSLVIALAVCATASRAARSQQPTPIPPLATAKPRMTPYKDPNLATVLGVVFPGAGQFYAERYGKGAGILAGTAAAAAIAIDASHSSRCNVGQSCNVHGIQTIGIIGAVAVWGYGWLTAGSDARRRNEQMLNRSTFAPFLDQHDGRLVAGLTFSAR